MNSTCPPAPQNKKEYILEIGKILVNDYGKQKYYKPAEVRKAHAKSKWVGEGLEVGVDFSCWAMSTFSSHSDFDHYHQETGEVCDYVEMKTEMLKGLSLADDQILVDVADFDIDISWTDFGEVFEGIGEFVAGIFEGFS